MGPLGRNEGKNRMKKLLVLVAVTCLILCSGCMQPHLRGVRHSDQARQLAKTRRAEAGGCRKGATEYALGVRKREAAIKTVQVKIAALREQQNEIYEVLRMLRARRAAAAPEGKAAMDKMINKELDRTASRQASISSNKTEIRALLEEIRHFDELRRSCLRGARQKEAEADSLEAYALELSRR